MPKPLSRWFRFYDSALDDPKAQQLSDHLFRVWVNFLCLASRAGGSLSPDVRTIAFSLRLSPGRTREALQALASARLIDVSEAGFTPHNWDARQYKSDVSTERVKRFRKRFNSVSRNGHVTADETPPDTEQKQNRTEQKDSEPTALAKPPPTPLDFKKELWARGVLFLKTCGLDEGTARSMLGKWRKTHGDQDILLALAAAEGAAVSEPIGYIQQTLNGKPKQNGHARHEQVSLATEVFGGMYAKARAEREASE